MNSNDKLKDMERTIMSWAYDCESDPEDAEAAKWLIARVKELTKALVEIDKKDYRVYQALDSKTNNLDMIHVGEIHEIDWDHVWISVQDDYGANVIYDDQREKIKKAVEKQLKGDK
jgi:hypothetical protein